MELHETVQPSRRPRPAGMPCPRCLGGQMFREEGVREESLVCLQCGHTRALQRRPAAVA